MFKKLFAKYIFKRPDEIIIALGTVQQSGSILIAISAFDQIWKKEKIFKKIKSVVTLSWTPSTELLEAAQKSILINQLFGDREDYGDRLFKLMDWHNSQKWNLSSITEKDQSRADSLQSMLILTMDRHAETSNQLRLSLAERSPFACELTYSMVVKIPVVSILYCVNIHSGFAFNSIRKSKHPQAESIIDYLYEILFLQQKTAITLHEYLKLINYAERQKNESALIGMEIDAIRNADLLFSYLKAGIEKIVALVGLTYGITNLDSKREHEKRMKLLKATFSQEQLDVPYIQFMFEFLTSQNLDELNNYRTGLLHKKGISDLQPHNYLGIKSKDLPLRKIFEVIHEQHSKNAAVLICALAILTDKLVELDPPDITVEELAKQLSFE